MFQILWPKNCCLKMNGMICADLNRFEKLQKLKATIFLDMIFTMVWVFVGSIEQVEELVSMWI